MVYTLSIPDDYRSRDILLDAISRSSLSYRLTRESEFDEPTLFKGLTSLVGEPAILSFIGRNPKK